MSTGATPEVLVARRTVEMGWRVGVSIVSVFGLACFVLLYFAFWAGGFTPAQSVVLVVVATLVFIAVNGASWAGWGMRWAGAPEPLGGHP